MSDDPAGEIVMAIIRAMSQPLVQQPAIPAIDDCDYRSVFKDSGKAYFGQGQAAGGPDSGRATRAADMAIEDLRRAMRGG